MWKHRHNEHTYKYKTDDFYIKYDIDNNNNINNNRHNNK